LLAVLTRSPKSGTTFSPTPHVYLPKLLTPPTRNGETGWPTAVGTDYDEAKGGLENAEHFYQHGFCSLLDWGFNAFFFEAFDEAWKPASIGDNGKVADETTWGAMTVDRKPKFSLKC
jgi:hypothetical protein